MSTEAVGIMNPAFFEGKKKLILWVNELLAINIKEVEQMATGAYHCQILDACYPGKVPLHKVNFNAKFDYEYVKNYKVLQEVFLQQGVQKYVDVPKLIKAKYQDNLEFFQWMKSFYDTHNTSSEPYDGAKRRKECGGSSQLKHPTGSDEKKATQASKPAPASAVKKTTAASKMAPSPATAKKTATAPATPAKIEDKSAEIEELNSKLTKLRVTIEGLEKERNFYFGKLRQIEVLCQQDETKDVETKAAVLKILYQTDTEEEFQAPASDGTEATGDAQATGEVAAEPTAEVTADGGDLLSSGAEESF